MMKDALTRINKIGHEVKDTRDKFVFEEVKRGAWPKGDIGDDLTKQYYKLDGVTGLAKTEMNLVQGVRKNWNEWEYKVTILTTALDALPRGASVTAPDVPSTMRQPRTKYVGISTAQLVKGLDSAWTVQIAQDLANVYQKSATLLGVIDNPKKPRVHHKIDLAKYPSAHRWAKPANPNQWKAGRINKKTGTGKSCEINLTGMNSGNDPANLKQQELYEKLGLLSDPSRPSQNLTRMHQIRGKFWGLSDVRNMFLGTASSNNLHKDSHYDQVESKIESAIGASRAALKNKDIVDWYIHYKVTPLFGVIPDYMKKRVSNTKKLDTKEKKDDAIDWLKEATPAKYKTQWSHYLLLDSKTGASSSYTEPDKTLSAEIR